MYLAHLNIYIQRKRVDKVQYMENIQGTILTNQYMGTAAMLINYF